MKKYYLYAVVMILTACAGLKKSNSIMNDWIDVEIKGLELPIHKMEVTNADIWASDYGDGVLYQSKDKGKSWSKAIQFGSQYIEVVHFVDEKNGFACGDYGYVYKTSNQGQTWEEISPRIEGRIIKHYDYKTEQPEGVFNAYYQMHFLDNKEGFVGGFSTEPKIGFRESFKNLLFHTVDGGNNWKKIENEKADSFMKSYVEKAEPSFESINNKYYFDKNKRIFIKKIRDKGNVVILDNLLTNKSDTVSLPPNPYKKPFLRDIVFLNQNIGYITGGALDEENEKAIIYETLDGGLNWTYIESDFPHIHTSLLYEDNFWISGKKNMIKRKKIKTNESIRQSFMND